MASFTATSGWNRKGNGTDDYGFAALPGGGWSSSRSFCCAGRVGYWWAATEDDDSNAYGRGMSYNNEYAADGSRGGKSFLHGVRCLQD
jgi:uncharacterized protein (TIGR02145 family)